MQCVHHRIPPFRLLRITRRQEDNHIAIHGVAFQVPLERSSMHLDMFNGHRLRALHHRRNNRLNLRFKSRPQSHSHKPHQPNQYPLGSHRLPLIAPLPPPSLTSAPASAAGGHSEPSPPATSTHGEPNLPRPGSTR